MKGLFLWIWDTFVSSISGHTPYHIFGLYFFLWLACLVYCIFGLKKSEDHKRILGVTLTMLILCLNPVMTLAAVFALSSSYWRVFWCLMIPLVIAGVITAALDRISSKKVKILCSILALVLLAATGTSAYEKGNYQEAENTYNIPQNVITICDYLEETGNTENIAFDTDLANYVRQYDANITMPYGRDGVDGMAEYLLSSPSQYFYLDYTESLGVKTVVLNHSRNMEELMADYGYEEIWSNETYSIYTKE